MRFLALVLAFVALPACGDPVIRRAGPLSPEAWVIAATDVPAAGQHLRFVAPTAESFGGLDVAVTDYEPVDGDGPRIALVGVVHVGDASYYKQLDELLAQFDVVLFEAVKRRDVSVDAWWADAKSKDSFAAAFQSRLASWLGMKYQLDVINYGAANFVHADMDLETFVEEGGAELIPGMDLDGDEDLPKGLKDVMEQFQGLGDMIFSPNSPFQSMARLAFAEQLGSMDIVEAIQMHPALGELILDKRNEVALDVLEATLPARAAGDSVAVFYGAAHNTGLEKALLERFGYRRSGGHWLRAWALRRSLD